MASNLEGAYEVVRELFLSEGLEILKKALRGEIKNDIQFQAAKSLMVCSLAQQGTVSTPITLNFGAVPRPKEIHREAPKELEEGKTDNM